MSRLPHFFALPLAIASLLPVPATRAQQRVPVPNALPPEEPESRPDREVVVPNLQGLPLPLAVLRLGSARLGVASVRPLETTAGPEDTVVRQSPSPGTRVPPGSAVRLWIARPRPVQDVVVPDLAGLPEAEARARLGRVNLRIGELEPQDSSRTAPDTVVRQSPSPGTRVPPGSAVRLWIARPRPVQDVVVPDLAGLPEAEARARLGRVNLRIGALEPQDTAAGTEGTVLRQSPPPGTRVPPGSAVRLWIARPRPVQDVVVPDLAGLPAAEARARLGRVNLRIGALEPQDTAAGTEGTVLRQSPPPGTRVPPGSAVRLWIARPRPVQDVVVPDLAGLPAAEARARLARVNLRIGELEPQDSSRTAPDTVVRQSPSPGTRVPPGSAVQLWIARPRPVQDVVVPDLRGLSMEAARGLIDGTELQLGEAGSQGSDPSMGKRVVAQQPAPGTRAAPGTTVQVWLNEERRAPAIPWPWLAIGAGLIGAGLAWRSRMVAKSTAPLRMVGLRDPGEQGIETHRAIQTDWQIRIRPQADQGAQVIVPLNVSGDGGE